MYFPGGGAAEDDAADRVADDRADRELLLDEPEDDDDPHDETLSSSESDAMVAVFICDKSGRRSLDSNFWKTFARQAHSWLPTDPRLKSRVKCVSSAEESACDHHFLPILRPNKLFGSTRSTVQYVR